MSEGQYCRSIGRASGRSTGGGNNQYWRRESGQSVMPGERLEVQPVMWYVPEPLTVCGYIEEVN